MKKLFSEFQKFEKTVISQNCLFLKIEKMKSCVRVRMGVMMMVGTVKGQTDLNAYLFIILFFR